MSEDTELSDGDYILKDGAAWFTVGTRSVRIVENDAGVLMISVWPKGREMDEPYSEIIVEGEPSND